MTIKQWIETYARELEGSDAERELMKAVRELVVNAKPEIQANPLGAVTIVDCQRGLDTYQANLLKAIGESDE